MNIVTITDLQWNIRQWEHFVQKANGSITFGGQAVPVVFAAMTDYIIPRSASGLCRPKIYHIPSKSHDISTIHVLYHSTNAVWHKMQAGPVKQEINPTSWFAKPETAEETKNHKDDLGQCYTGQIQNQLMTIFHFITQQYFLRNANAVWDAGVCKLQHQNGGIIGQISTPQTKCTFTRRFQGFVGLSIL